VKFEQFFHLITHKKRAYIKGMLFSFW